MTIEEKVMHHELCDKVLLRFLKHGLPAYLDADSFRAMLGTQPPLVLMKLLAMDDFAFVSAADSAVEDEKVLRIVKRRSH